MVSWEGRELGESLEANETLLNLMDININNWRKVIHTLSVTGAGSLISLGCDGMPAELFTVYNTYLKCMSGK